MKKQKVKMRIVLEVEGRSSSPQYLLLSIQEVIEAMISSLTEIYSDEITKMEMTEE